MNSTTRTNTSKVSTKTTLTLTKIISFILVFVLALTCPLSAYAAKTTTSTTKIDKQTVTLICKVSDDIETDDYSPVVVKLLNEDTFETFEFKLYKYNNFAERYEMPYGVYSILWARIDNRNDIVFEVKSAESFRVGTQNTIYFELYDSYALGQATTTTETTRKQNTTKKDGSLDTTTEPPTLYTLYDISSHESESNSETETETETESSTELSTEEPTTSVSTETVTTTENHAQEERAQNLSVIFIIMAVIILLTIACIVVMYLKKRGESK